MRTRAGPANFVTAHDRVARMRRSGCYALNHQLVPWVSRRIFAVTMEFLVGNGAGHAASVPGSVKASRWSPKSAMISRRPPRAST